MSKDKQFTEEIQCRHCGNSAPMEVLRSLNDLREDEGYDQHGGLSIAYSWDVGDLYQLAKCPACQGLSFRRAGWHSGSMDPSEIEFETLYPPATATEIPRGLPELVRKAFEAALKVRGIDANAYAVLLGRVLEMVCKDRDATGDTLAKKLADLSAKNEIPERLARVAKGIRQLRNVGAHADLGELTEAEVPVLDNLTRALLEYVYTAPVLVEEAEKRLHKLAGKANTADKLDTLRKKRPKGAAGYDSEDRAE